MINVPARPPIGAGDSTINRSILRGIVNGVLFAVPIWAAIVGAVWWWLA